MKLKFLVDSYQSSTQSYCMLDIFQNFKKKYSIKNCTQKNMEFTFQVDCYSIIDFLVTNKNPQDTLFENDGTIKDTYLRINKIFIDEYDVLPKINLFSNYFTQNQGVLRTNGFMNYNGLYRMKFRFPLSNHLILCRYYTPKS